MANDRSLKDTAAVKGWRTVHLRTDSYKALKLFAAASDQRIGDVLADAIKEYLTRKRRNLNLHTLIKGNGNADSRANR